MHNSKNSSVKGSIYYFFSSKTHVAFFFLELGIDEFYRSIFLKTTDKKYTETYIYLLKKILFQ